MSFTDVLNLSISASWLVLAVVLARLLLKKAPKALHCALWALVAIRLLCPVSFESELSLIPSREVIPQSYLSMQPKDPEFREPAELEIITNPIYDESITVPIEPTVDRVQFWDVQATVVWMFGMGVMAVYAAYSYLSLRLRVRMAAWSGGNLWECDDLDTPFILGLLRPRIYLPSELDENARPHVLAHENAHLKRLDHIWKPLGFLLLSIHWFNPLMWLAYILLCRDIELACDEKVIKDLDKPGIAAYSQALVTCSVSHRMIAACPLAFGEVGVKGRIRSVLHYKKPGFWILLAAVLAMILLAVCFLTDPAPKEITLNEILSQEDCHITELQEQTLKLEVKKTDLPENVLNGKTHSFEDAPILLQQFDDTGLYLTAARMSGDELLITITAEHTFGERGAVLLPAHPFSDGVRTSVRMSHYDAVDSAAVYPDAVRLREHGPDSFSVAVKADVWNQARDYIRFQLEGLHRLAYTFEPLPVETVHTVRSYAPANLAGMLLPTFQLSSDGSFRFSENALSSYLGVGQWVQEDGTLTLATDDGRFVWTFDVVDGSYLYDAERSSPITYYFDMCTPKTLGDGVRFEQQDIWETASDPVSDAVETVIQDLWQGPNDRNHFSTHAWRILHMESFSGTPLLSGGAPAERLTVYVAALCRTFALRSDGLEDAGMEILHAALEFDISGDTLTLLGMSCADSEGDPAMIYSREAMDLWLQQENAIIQDLESICIADAEYHFQAHLPTEDEVSELLNLICSSPAQSSNPGDYIHAHPEEYERLVNLGVTTVSYCFGQFAEGNCMDLRGHIMALACQEIIAPTETFSADSQYMTGQAWFNDFAAHADALREELGAQELAKVHPYHAMALEKLGI